jgi:uncharacterized protein (DUF305 family)
MKNASKKTQNSLFAVLKNRRALVPAVMLASGLVLAGCAGGSGTAPGSSPASDGGHGAHQSGTQESGGQQSGGASAAAHNASDTAFAQAMMVHHQQALDMSETMLAKKDVPQDVTALAGRIKAAQGPEIQSMTTWLKSWNEPVEMSGGHAGHGMDGMVSKEDLAKLDAAQGKEAAKLFLTQMIAHHEGAVAMAGDQVEKGQDQAAVALAKEIITAQQAEIKEMQDLLAGLG